MTTTRHKHRFWRLLRIYFRRFRITVWICVLLLLGTLIYLNQVGLPGFIKKPLLEKLRASGVDLQFSRLRLRWPQGIVAENVRFGPATEASHPEMRAAQVQVQLDYRALRRFRLQVDSLRLRHGSIIWPMPDPAQTNRQLAVEDIQTDLELLPGDQWQLEHFTAGFAGARIQLSGAVTNASAVRDWKFLHGEKTAAGTHWQERLRTFADTLQKIQFSAAPDLRMDVRGDARDLLSFQVRLMVNTPGAITPWGSVDDGKLVVRLFPDATNGISRMQLDLEAAAGNTEWASATNLHLNIEALSRGDHTNQVEGSLAISSAAVATKWGQATNVHFDAQWVHGFTNAVPLQGRGELVCGSLETAWCRAREVDLKGNLEEHADFHPHADPSWAWWEGLAPYPLQWELQAKDFEREDLRAASLSGRGRWRAPDLTLTNFHAELYERNLLLNAALDVATGKLQTRLASDVDPHKIEHVLTPAARHWLAQFTWNSPPRVDGTVSLVLPSWTNSNPDWRAEVKPGLVISGKLQVPDGGTFRGVPASTARSSFLYSNLTWYLPDLVATRPEGRIEVAHISNEQSKDFYYRFHSDIDPMSVLPVLGTNEARGLKLFTFSSTPAVEAEVWGNWQHQEAIGLKGQASLKNFTFRGENIDSLQTALAYTNRLLTFTKPQALRGPQVYQADSVIVDFNAERIYLTNGFSTGDPMVVARAIGKHVVKAIEPYQFLLPPKGFVHGVIPMKHDEDADLYFQLSGGPFRWQKFRVPQISGEVHWYGRHVSIMDVDAQFYGGKLKGSAGFEFTQDRGPEFHFTALGTNVALEALISDLTTKTNHLEGTLEGRITVKRGNLSRTNDVDGDGYVSLRDGLIWTIPIFGVFSGPLDRIHQGLGSSRAKEGEGHFSITNGVIYTGDTEIRSPAMRLEYRGSVDLDGNVNARVEAQVLRDVWLIGPIVSTVLWPFAKMFEYKLSGTLSQPKTELLYFGKPVPTPETETSAEKRSGPQGAARPP